MLDTAAASRKTGERADSIRALGVLRNDGQSSARPLPTLEDIPGLIDAVRRSGLDVERRSEGSPRGSANGVSGD